MADLKQPFDVAVLDEYQLISDYQRGWAWTRAFLGLQASEIHLTGDPSRVGPLLNPYWRVKIDLIKHIVSLTGDSLEVKYYERLLPLETESGLSGSPLNIRAGYFLSNSLITEGDAVIAFSRKDVFSIKRTIESYTKHKCCVVYGNLPPESRKKQAELFNTSSEGHSVLVGTVSIRWLERQTKQTGRYWNGIEPKYKAHSFLFCHKIWRVIIQVTIRFRSKADSGEGR